MVGVVRYVREKGRTPPSVEYAGGIALLTATLHEPEGLSAPRLARRLDKLERTFCKAGVSRVILPVDFPHAGRLKWVKPVETLTFYRGVADVLALGLLRTRHIPPEGGAVALAAPRLCPEVQMAARYLCPVVRSIRIDVPGGEGVAFAQALQREWGLPVMPQTAPADAIVSFGPPGEGADLRLWGESPWLGGLRLVAEGQAFPPELEQPLLALLWEQGRLRKDQLQATTANLSSERPKFT